MMPLANTLHRRLRDELEAIRCLSAQTPARRGAGLELASQVECMGVALAGWGWFDTRQAKT